MTEHLTVTSLLIWQMNTASSTNRFKIQGFSSLFCFASFYRHQSIRNGTTPSNCNNTFWLPGGRRWRPPGLTSLTPPPPLPLPKNKQTVENQTRTAPSSPARPVCLASLPAGPERVRLSVKNILDFFFYFSYCTDHTVEVQLSATCWCTNMNKWFKEFREKKKSLYRD